VAAPNFDLTAAQDHYLKQVQARDFADSWSASFLIPFIGKSLDKTIERVLMRLARKLAPKGESQIDTLSRLSGLIAESCRKELIRQTRKWVRTLRSRVLDTVIESVRANPVPTKASIRRAMQFALRQWKGGQLKIVVETDALRAMTKMTDSVMTALDNVKQKIWVTQQDGRVRKSHRKLDGQIVPKKDRFRIPGTNRRAMGPGQFGIAEEDINCRCQALPYPPPVDKRRVWRLLDRLMKTVEISYRNKILRWAKQAINTSIKSLKTYKGPLPTRRPFQAEAEDPGFAATEEVIQLAIERQFTGEQTAYDTLSSRQQKRINAITAYSNGPVDVMRDPDLFDSSKSRPIPNKMIIDRNGREFSYRIRHKLAAKGVSSQVKKLASHPITQRQQDALVQAPRPGGEDEPTFYRGIALSKTASKALTAGSTFTLRDVSSFSLNQRVAKDFAFNNKTSTKMTVIFEIPLRHMKRGTYIGGLSHYRHEYEMLTSGKIKVDSVRQDGSTFYVRARQVDD